MKDIYTAALRVLPAFAYTPAWVEKLQHVKPEDVLKDNTLIFEKLARRLDQEA